MKKLIAMIGVLSLVVLLTGSAYGLDIQLSPRTLVLSSGGHQLTIHTDVPYRAVDGAILDIGDSSDVAISTFADDCGNLVVRCRKDAVEDAVGDFRGRFTTIDVTLWVTYVDEDLKTVDTSATETLRVKK